MKKRVISVNVNDVKGPRSTNYAEVVGSGRLGLGLYAAWQKQLELCHRELGFQYLRCHGVLEDQLGVYREGPKGNPIYNFQYIDLVYDFLHSIGMRPFVELSFMPDALATIPSEKADAAGYVSDPNYPGGKRRVTVFWWHANVTPPKDPKKWEDLITALTKHWTERYGANEVKKWWFEIWNEPNIEAFWSPNNPGKRQQEYFQLYAETAEAVKKVNSAYRVGGPASAGPGWVDALINFCVKSNVPIDFVSFHTYGLGNPGALDEYGHRRLYLNSNLHAVAEQANHGLFEVRHSARPDLPVHVTEWSTSYSDRDPVHDAYFSAPFILEQIKNTEGLSSMSYWAFSDIFEENGVPPSPFFGGFGLLNVQGIKKPAFFAYRFLHRLGPEELVNADSRSWVCRDKSGGVQALFWDMTMPDMKGESDQVFFRKIHPARPVAPVVLSVSGLKPGRYHLLVYRVGYEENDAYTAYLKMGAPHSLSPKQVDELKAKTSDLPQRESVVSVPKSGKWEDAFPLHTDEVVLVELEPF